jgi:hypothetical protein
LFASLTGAALAGSEAVWDEDRRLTSNSFSEWCYWGGQRRIAAGPDGRIHAVWYARVNAATDSFEIHYVRYNPGSGWSADTVISADLAANQNKYPSVAVDSGNTVWVTWASLNGSNSFIYTKSCAPSGNGNDSWDPISTLLSTAPSSTAKDCPTMAATPDGHVHACWVEGTSAFKYREYAGSWLPEQTISTNSLYKVYPILAAGRDNNLCVAYHGYYASGNTYYNVMAIRRVGGVWQPPENVSNATRHQMYPNVTVSPLTNEPEVVWRGYPASGSGNQYRVVYSRRTGGAWTPGDTLSEYGSTISQGPPQIACTPDGLSHVVWPGQYSSMTKVELLYRERDAGGVWQPYVMLTDTTGIREYPSISADAGNSVHVDWLDYRSSPAEMYYKHGSPLTGFSSGSPLEPVGLSFAIAPNPLRSGITSISTSLPLISHPSSLSVYSVMGRPILSRTVGRSSPRTLSLDLRGLSAGVYLVKLSADGYTTSQKLVVER